MRYNSLLNSLTVFEKVGLTISKLLLSTCACTWGDIIPQSTVPKKMATGTFTHIYSSQRTQTLKTLIKTQRKALKTSNLAYGMLLAQGQINAKNVAFYELIGCVRLAWYCGKMYSRHLFPYGGL